MKTDFLFIHKSIVPKNYLAVIEARRMIDEDKISVCEACKRVDISRGTFYKYKDYVFVPANEIRKRAILAFYLDDEKGVLSNLLNYIANSNGNILAINQEMPINNSAYVTITVDIIDMHETVNDFLEKVKQIKGIKKAKLIAIE